MMESSISESGSTKLGIMLPRRYCAYYARYWMEQHPEYPKFFKKRSRTIGPLTSRDSAIESAA
jgi:hypothetical protein